MNIVDFPTSAGRRFGAGRLWRALLAVTAMLALAAGCKKDDKKKPPATAGSGSATTAGSGDSGSLMPQVTRGKDIDSKDILARTEVGEVSDVKHILLAWKELSPTYGGQLEAPASTRSNEATAKLAEELLGKLRANPDSMDALIKEHSQDKERAEEEGHTEKDGHDHAATPPKLMPRTTPYEVRDNGQYVPEFTKMALRLKIKEVGVVQTQFGYHIMMRVPPPPPDPIESSEILRRNSHGESVFVKHILIGWKGAPAFRGGGAPEKVAARSKEQADELVKQLLERAKKGEAIEKLMAEFSDDPNSAASGRAYPVSDSTNIPQPFKNLSMRLALDEVGIVKTDVGLHVVKRVPPPPPDPLDSKDLLAREPVTQKSTVKHILLGWKDNGNPRASEAAKKRTRAQLDALVKKTVADLKKGKPIEPLMKELSEDPGSAEGGTSYEVTPDSAFVEPFKKLSLRLNLKEVGVVATDFGIHIIQRVEDAPPPPPPAPPGATPPPAPAGDKPAAPPPAPAGDKPAAPPPAPTK